MPSSSNIRDQIAAKRAVAQKIAPVATTGNASSGRNHPAQPAGNRTANDRLEDKSLESEISKARRHGKLDISSLSFDRIPAEVYSSLLGIPADQLSHPLDSTATGSSSGDGVKGLTSSFSSHLALRGKDTGDGVFSKGKQREEWVEPEAELVSLKAEANRIREIDVEIGAFGGLKAIDFSSNQISSLPDSFADLLRLTSLNLSHNAFNTLPSQILLLPKLEVLDISYNAIEMIDFSAPIEPSDDGLAYGAGFLSTSFSRAAKKGGKEILPSLRSLNLAHNRLGVESLAGLGKSGSLKSLSFVNLESNAISGVLDLEDAGLDAASAPQLSSLNLNGNSGLREVRGEAAKGCAISQENESTSDFVPPNRQKSSANVAKSSSTPAKDGNKATQESVPQPDMTLVYRTLPAATFDSLPLDVDLDLYLPSEPSSSAKGHPLVVWFHGGGLLQGNKENLPPHFRRLPSYSFESANGTEQVAVISPNYRLAPQVPIIDILSDVTALLAFVRTKLNDRIAKAGKSHRIDADRICLSGGSAGGYLALIAGLVMPDKSSDEEIGGYRGEKGVKCVAPFYPITDLTDIFWATETNPVPWWDRSIPHAEAKPHLELRAPPVATAKSGGPRSILYPYMLQHGLFPSLLFMNQRSIGSGLDGFRPSPEALSITTRMELLQKHKSGHLPIYLIYGDEDDKVQRFDKTVAIMKQVVGGEVVIECREGADHQFDEDPAEECPEFRAWLGRTLL